MNTIHGSVWDLHIKLPTVKKPTRGLFVYVEEKRNGPASPQIPPGAERKLAEADFYEPFATWLQNDLEEVTDAVPLGGAGLRYKWGTPDVVGIYRPKKYDIVQFHPDVIAAEIKVDPSAHIEAFGQACAYRLFAAKSFVVMPNTMRPEDKARLDALCMSFGLGFVLFDPNVSDPGSTRFVIQVRAQRFPPDMYFLNDFAKGLKSADKAKFERLFG